MLSGDVQTFLILANACSCRESFESIAKVGKIGNKKSPNMGQRNRAKIIFQKKLPLRVFVGFFEIPGHESTEDQDSPDCHTDET